MVKSAVTALRLYLMRRTQWNSVRLRTLFRETYGIDVGMYSYGCFDRWRMRGPMKVGRYCSIAPTARSALDNHPLDALTTHPILYEPDLGVVDEPHRWTGSLEIEDDVWVGQNVVILAGCKKIGRGAVIGAGSIVTKDVPRYAVMAGNPARKLRDRFDPALIEAIEASRWWELSVEELRAMVRADRELVFKPQAAALRAWTERRRAIRP